MDSDCFHTVLRWEIGVSSLYQKEKQTFRNECVGPWMEEDLSLQSGWPDHPMWPLLINEDSGFTRQEKKGLGGRTLEEKWVGLEVVNVLPA